MPHDEKAGRAVRVIPFGIIGTIIDRRDSTHPTAIAPFDWLVSYGVGLLWCRTRELTALAPEAPRRTEEHT